MVDFICIEKLWNASIKWCKIMQFI